MKFFPIFLFAFVSALIGTGLPAKAGHEYRSNGDSMIIVNGELGVTAGTIILARHSNRYLRKQYRQRYYQEKRPQYQFHDRRRSRRHGGSLRHHSMPPSFGQQFGGGGFHQRSMPPSFGQHFGGGFHQRSMPPSFGQQFGGGGFHQRSMPPSFGQRDPRSYYKTFMRCMEHPDHWKCN